MATALEDVTQLARRSERIRNARGINLIRTIAAGVFFLLFVFFGRVQGNPEWLGGDLPSAAYLALAVLLWWAGRRSDEVSIRSGLALALLDVPMIAAIELTILPTAINPQELVGSSTATFVLLIFASGALLNVHLIIAAAVAAAAAQTVLQLHVALDLGNAISAFGIFTVAAMTSVHLTSRLDKLVEQAALKLAEAHRHEATLARAVDLESRVIADAGLGVAAVDEQLRLRLWNPYLERLTGLPSELVVGRQPWTLLPELRDLETEIPAVLAGGAVELPDRAVRIRGREVWMEMTVGPMRGPRGEVAGAVVFLRDISASKRSEAQREELEEQLRVSQKMEAIGSLAGGVAHDFNNLLSVILSYTEFAMEGVREGDPLRNDLLEVHKAADRAVALTRQLLAFSRKQVLQPVALNLNQVATGVEKMLGRILGEDIDLIHELAPDLRLTLADPGQIEQVLMNLAVNARDAMPEGGRLTIGTSNVEIDEEYAARHVAVKPGSYVQLAITDTGCGIDEQTKARVFEPFFTTKEKGKGTGLGLSTVYGIVRQSGGDILVSSELGQGTTFKVYLPVDFSTAAATAIKPSTAPRQTTGTETILLVEDEAALRKVAERSLEAAGYRVLTASDGVEALLMSTRHVGEIQLLLADVIMPGMSGSAFAQELSKTRPTCKVLYMSGYTDDAIVHRGVLDAGTHFLAKPFTAADLVRKVREVLDQGMTTDEQRSQRG